MKVKSSDVHRKHSKPFWWTVYFMRTCWFMWAHLLREGAGLESGRLLRRVQQVSAVSGGLPFLPGRHPLPGAGGRGSAAHPHLLPGSVHPAGRGLHVWSLPLQEKQGEHRNNFCPVNILTANRIKPKQRADTIRSLSQKIKHFVFLWRVLISFCFNSWSWALWLQTSEFLCNMFVVWAEEGWRLSLTWLIHRPLC